MMVPTNIPVTDRNLGILMATKTQELSKALDEQSKALDDLLVALKDFNDWLDEEIVRLEGEK